MKILIVDDDSMLLDCTLDMLTDAGHECTAAVDGVDAFEKFERGNFDLVVTDIEMPNKNGVELTRSIRKISDVPILARSGRMYKYRADVVEAGASLTLEKLVEPSVFLHGVEKFSK